MKKAGPTGKQVTLEHAIGQAQKYSFDHPRSRLLHRAIGEMVCVDCLPMYIVEKPGFRRLVHAMEPRYTPCSRNYLSQTLIPNMYERVRNCVFKLVDVVPYVSITTDLWSSQAQDSYLSLTGHWIDDSWERKEGCFHAQPFNERHTGEHIKNIVTGCVEKWQLAGKLHLVLRDNGRNFVAGLRDAEIPNVGCLAHTLQLVVKEGVLAQRGVEDLLSCCRRIVGHFKHSNVAWHALNSIQEKLGLPMHRPVQDEPTRWNSSYYMLSWIAEQKQGLLAVSADISLPLELTTAQWQLTEKVLHVLKPFEEATKETSYLTCSVSVVIPIVNALVRQLEKENEDDQGIKAMKHKLLAGLLSRYEGMESNRFFAVASALDPRYKLRCFSSASKAAAARQMLLEEIEKLQPSHKHSESEPPAKRPRVQSKSSLLACVEEMLEHSSDSENELDSPEVITAAYLKEPNLPIYESVSNPVDPQNPNSKRNDPLLYWKQNEQSKPILAKIARQFLCAPPGSVPSERLFSTAGDIADDKRNRLLPDKVEMLLFLNKNLRLLNFEY